MNQQTEIIIVGAGAAGLMAALELSKAGKKVMILEARNRIGGRIWPLDGYNYPAQGGAEFVHGAAPLTKQLIKEAGLNFLASRGTEIWSTINGGFSKDIGFIDHDELLQEKLRELKTDMPLSEFFDKYFSDAKFSQMKDSITRTVENYDAAEVNRVSTITLREEWLGNINEWQQGRIREGYGALLEYLKNECQNNGVKIQLEKKVISISIAGNSVIVKCNEDNIFEAKKVIVTLPISLLKTINYQPQIPEQLAAAAQIGFGHVIKIVMQFKSRWWLKARGLDLSKLSFVRSKEIVPTWWTQYPEVYPVLIGWLAGPNALKQKDTASDKIVESALDSLVNIFEVKTDFLRENLEKSEVFNWPADPLSQGAYSYSTPESKQACEVLLKSINNILFFAGEALFSGQETATVEGALGSGKEVAERILKSYG